MLRLRGLVLVLIVAAGCMWWGSQKAWVAATNRAPAKITCADFAAGRSSATWVELSDSWLDYDNAIALEDQKSHRSRGVFVPVRPIGKKGSASIVLELKDEDVKARVIESEAAYKAQVDGTDPLHGETIRGMVRFGIDSAESKLERAIRDNTSQGVLASQFAIIQNGDRPGENDLLLGSGAAVLPPGLVGLFIWNKIRRHRKPKGPPAVPGMIA